MNQIWITFYWHEIYYTHTEYKEYIFNCGIFKILINKELLSV